jgi:hypothetical protein
VLPTGAVSKAEREDPLGGRRARMYCLVAFSCVIEKPPRR